MKLKRLIAYILCVTMLLPVFACSKPDSGVSGGGGNDPVVDLDATFTITFNIGADATAAGIPTPIDQTVKYGKTISFLPTPNSYSNYYFDGWYENGERFTKSTVVTRDWNLTAKWTDNTAALEYENDISTWAQSGHLYIHYKRYDHKESEQTVAGTPTNTVAPEYSNAINSSVYGDWGLWCWPKEPISGDGRLFNAAWIDESGAVYDVLLDHDYTDAGWDGTNKRPMNSTINYADASSVGIQLFQISTRTGSGFWANDGGNIEIKVSKIARENGDMHWFVTQGNVGSGKDTYAVTTLEDPYKDDADRTKNGTKISGEGFINSSVDNSSTYPTLKSKVVGYDEAGVGYQIFIASFNDSDGDGMGDLKGITNKLDYLKSLNVDVLWLTPFQTSTNYHGYDIKDYFSVDSRFGTLADYRELVYKAHQKGMKVIMDLVLNHTAQANPWFVKSQNLVKETRADGTVIDYRQFYSWITQSQYDALTAEEKTQWYKDAYGYYFYSSFSSDQPELNYDYQPVRDAILDVCNYWMEFGLDGFRLDAVKHIYMLNEVEGVGKTASSGQIYNGSGVVSDGLYSHDLTRNLNFYREFNYRLKANYPNAFLVGENLDGNPLNITSYYQGLDSQFNFNLYYDAARAFAASQQSDLNCGYATTAINAYLQGYYGNDYDVDKDGTPDHVKGYSETNSNFIDGLFTSNHDLPRARDRVNITTNSTANTDKYRNLTASDIERTDNLLRMYYAYIMTMPGLNWIYYGDEIGMSGLMQSTVNSGSTSTTESEAHEDRIYRQPMKWTASGNASYSIGYGDLTCELTGINATSAIKSVEEQNADSSSLLSWMKTLTKVRNDNPTLINGKVEKTNNNMEGSTIFYTVKSGSTSIRVYINVGDYSFTVPSGTVLASYGMSGGKLNRYGIAIVKV